MDVLALSRWRTSSTIKTIEGGHVRWRRVFAAAVVALGATALAQGKDLALISNKSNEVVAITFPEMVKVCKGQLNRWPDGKPVSFITRDPTAPEMKILLEKVYEMSKDEVKAAIAGANHGRADHPAIVVVDTDEAVVKKVESTPGAIGLVDVYSISGGVTVLKVGGKLPLEPGYPLHGN
jgi:ABC-type phosphate transport system substrate-binding protein